MGAEENDRQGGVAHNEAQRLHAVHTRHLQIKGHDIGLQLGNFSQRECAVHGGANNLDGRFARQNRGDIQDEDNRSVTENGSTADQVAGDELARQRFDHQFLFSNQAIHDETKSFFSFANDDDKMFLSNRLGIDAAQTAKVIQPNESKNLFAKPQHFTLFHAVNLRILNSSDFHNRRERDSEKTAADAEKQRLNTRKRERRTKLNCRAAAFLRRDMHGTLEAAEDGTNDIHADATARNFRHFGSGAESRLENEVESLLIGQALRPSGFQDALFNGAR